MRRFHLLPVHVLAGAPAALTAALTVAFIISGAVRAEEPATIDDVERQIDEAAARLETLDAEIASGRTIRRELEAAVAAAESRIGERGERIAGLEADIARFEARLIELEAAVERERGDVDTRRARLAEALRGTRRLGEASGLRVVLQHEDPALAERLGVYADYLLRAQRTALDEQTRALVRIEAAHETALKDRNWLEHIKRKATGQRAAHAVTRAARAARLDAVAEDLAAKTRSLAELKADRARLQALMEELLALQSSRSGYFAAGKGRYALPVKGTVEANFGETKSVGKLRWNGLFVAAASGTPVRAVADGEVVYADWLRGFGLLVIVDHGDDFMTLYGGNRDVVVTPGDWVAGGATIATVGDSGGQSMSGVYFEIRERSRPLDPGPWLARGDDA